VKLIFAEEAWDDYVYWQQQDKRVVKRVNDLIEAVMRDPFNGIGKPEPFKHALAGFWSRRISEEHRMVYKVENDALMIAQLRYHY
jgi:toxin YoeB